MPKQFCGSCGGPVPVQEGMGRPFEFCTDRCRRRLDGGLAAQARLKREKQHHGRVILQELRVMHDLLTRGVSVFSGALRTWPAQLVVRAPGTEQFLNLTMTDSRTDLQPYEALATVLPDGRILYRGLGDVVGDAVAASGEPGKTEGGTALAIPPPGATVADDDD